MRLNLREQYEALNGKIDDRLYNHILELALDDQKQYVNLTGEELRAILDPALFPPDNRESERLDEIRERLLESMEIIADIVTRRRIHHS